MNIEIRFSNVNSADMARLAEALKLLGQASEDNLPDAEEVKVVKTTGTKPAKASKKSDPVGELPFSEAKTKRSLEDLREFAIKLAKDGKGEAVKKVIISHGLDKISSTPIDLIDKVYADLEAL